MARSRRAFERLVAEAVESIPERFRERLRNVAVVIEDAPTAEQCEAGDIDPEEGMYACYEGVPITERDTDGEPILPDRIVIFQRTLEEDYGDDAAELQRQIALTIRHEIAHHFGLEDDRIEELEDGWAKGLY